MLKRETVDLDHDAVGCERQLLPGLIPTTDVLVDFVHVAAQGDLVRDFKSPLTGRHQAVVMRSERQVVADERIERTVELAPGRLGRALLLERTGGRIAGIGERRLAYILPLAIQSLERTEGHQYLAPDLEIGRIARPPQLQRNGTYRPDIGRHVIAARTVAARHGPQQTAVLVSQADCGSVELQFAYILGLADLLANPRVELPDLVERVGVGKRQHRIAVLDRTEFVGGVAPHAPGRRVGIVELGMGRLQLLQLAQQGVELIVSDQRIVQHVVPVIMLVDLSSQLLYFLAHFFNN